MELHKISTSHTNETVVAGRTTGLFEKGDTVKWRAKHFGIYQHLEMKITDMKPPVYFEDCMLKGIFKSITHKHYFEKDTDHTIMKDEFIYEVPFGIAGKIFDALFLRKYLTDLLKKRNETIKHFAES
ncbi:MAG: SRPBCC family protein [Agriterribacter sp.]